MPACRNSSVSHEKRLRPANTRQLDVWLKIPVAVIDPPVPVDVPSKKEIAP